MLRPKNRYSTSPTTGSNRRTVTQARLFTGLRFSDSIIIIISIVDARAIQSKAEYIQLNECNCPRTSIIGSELLLEIHFIESFAVEFVFVVAVRAVEILVHV